MTAGGTRRRIDVGVARREGNRRRCDVHVDGRHYDVTVADSDVAELTPAQPPETVIRASFEFLLEREPPESILPSFDLSVIERYFPGYRREIRRRLEA